MLTQGQVSVLVNNVEKADPVHPSFQNLSDAEIIQTINANTFPMILMSRFLGPGLRSRVESEGKHSAIINMVSSYSDYPVSSKPLFSAAKSFEDMWSTNLWYENQGIGQSKNRSVDILTVKNLPTRSSDFPNGVSAVDTVSGVLKDLGYERVSYGHSSHSLMRPLLFV